MKYTIDDYKNEVECFYNSFNDFSILTENNLSLPIGCEVTKSVDIFVLKYGLFHASCKEERSEIRKHYKHVDEDAKYDNFNSFYTYYESFSEQLVSMYIELYNKKYFVLKSESTLDNLLGLGREYRKKYLRFVTEAGPLNEMMNDSIFQILKEYFWVRKYKKVASMEKIMDILRAGGVPCGYKVTKESENPLDNDIEFLVYYPHE